MSTDPKISSERPSGSFRVLWLKLRQIPTLIFGSLVPAVLNERLDEWLNRHWSTLSSTRLSDDTKRRARLLIEPLKAKLRHEIVLDAIVVRVTLLILTVTVLSVPGAVAYIYHLPASYVGSRIGFIYLVTLVFFIPLGIPGWVAEQNQGEPSLFGPQGEEIRYRPRFAGWWESSLLFLYAVLVARIVQISPPSESYGAVPPYFVLLCSLILILTVVIFPLSWILLAVMW